MNKIRLVLIEDNRLLRDGISAMLKGHRDIDVIATSGKSENTILKIRELLPDIILLSLGLQTHNSLQVVELVKKEFSQARVIVTDLDPGQGDILPFVKAGASGFILKTAASDDFLATIRSVAGGEMVLPPLLIGTLFSQIMNHSENGNKLNHATARLTNREEEVVALICDGLSNKEIAVELHIATFTVKSHVHNIMEKLALHKRLEVATFTFANGSLRKEIK